MSEDIRIFKEAEQVPCSAQQYWAVQEIECLLFVLYYRIADAFPVGNKVSKNLRSMLSEVKKEVAEHKSRMTPPEYAIPKRQGEVIPLFQEKERGEE